MSTPTSPATSSLPTRSNTVRSSWTAGTPRRDSLSEDEAIPSADSSETTNLLVERLRAWKHMCVYLEDYVSATAKVQKSQSKDYEKILKTVSDPLKEGHHFSQSAGGVASMFENMRANTQGMVNMHLDAEKNIKGTVLPILERLHKEIKAKGKEVQGGASKSAKAVDKARSVTQKHIELLGQQTASFDSAAGNKIEKHHDPYILRRGVNHRLNKQVTEENNSRQDIISVQNNFQQFEAHVIQTCQGAMDQFIQFVNGQLDRQRTMYTDMLGNAQQVPLDFEWVNFMTRNNTVLVDPDSPPRSLSNISFPNQDHKATKPLIEGSLERKSRAVMRGYSSGYYVVTAARYLHEFKDDDDFRRDPTPDLTLYLPDCVIGATDGAKFSVKGKDVSGNMVGNAFHTTTELHFKAHTPDDAEKWFTVIKDASRGHVAASSSAAATPTSPAPTTPATETPTDAATTGVETNGAGGAQPPAYADPSEKTAADATTGTAAGTEAGAASGEAQSPAVATTDAKSPTVEEPASATSATSPGGGLSRAASTATGHFHTGPTGEALNAEKKA